MKFYRNLLKSNPSDIAIQAFIVVIETQLRKLEMYRGQEAKIKPDYIGSRKGINAPNISSIT